MLTHHFKYVPQPFVKMRPMLAIRLFLNKTPLFAMGYISEVKLQVIIQ